MHEAKRKRAVNTEKPRRNPGTEEWRCNLGGVSCESRAHDPAINSGVLGRGWPLEFHFQFVFGVYVRF